MLKRVLVSVLAPLFAVTALHAGAGAGFAVAAAGIAPVNVEPPRIEGEAVVDQVLNARRGRWEQSSDLTFRYRWFRGDERIAGLVGGRKRYQVQPGDRGQRITVRVQATAADGQRSFVLSSSTDPVARAPMVNRVAPDISGTRRYGHLVRADPGEWSGEPRRITYQWFRGSRPIAGATHRRHRIRPADVGRRISVQVRATAPGYTWGEARSPRRLVRHRVGVRRTATYEVVRWGATSADMATFRRQVQQTFDDPRGWRGAGVRFRRVSSGGDFTVVLATPDRVEAAHPVCSRHWSCRVGRYVIINEMRWQQATPAWNNAGGKRRGYRHMVVNHEAGHWLGHGHRSCPGPGQAAPVMLQQSIDLQGCRLNPWPTLPELRATR